MRFPLALVACTFLAHAAHAECGPATAAMAYGLARNPIDITYANLENHILVDVNERESLELAKLTDNRVGVPAETGQIAVCREHQKTGGRCVNVKNGAICER